MHYKLYIIKKSSFNYNNVTIPILFCNTAFFFPKPPNTNQSPKNATR